jgi:hypothetical protein
MKKAYDLRSTLVHGGSAPYLRQLRGEITENDELINLVADNVRNAILQALDIVSSPQGTALDDTYWDRIIFS